MPQAASRVVICSRFTIVYFWEWMTEGSLKWKKQSKFFMDVFNPLNIFAYGLLQQIFFYIWEFLLL